MNTNPAASQAKDRTPIANWLPTDDVFEKDSASSPTGTPPSVAKIANAVRGLAHAGDAVFGAIKLTPWINFFPANHLSTLRNKVGEFGERLEQHSAYIVNSLTEAEKPARGPFLSQPPPSDEQIEKVGLKELAKLGGRAIWESICSAPKAALYRYGTNLAYGFSLVATTYCAKQLFDSIVLHNESGAGTSLLIWSGALFASNMISVGLSSLASIMIARHDTALERSVVRRQFTTVLRLPPGALEDRHVALLVDLMKTNEFKIKNVAYTAAHGIDEMTTIATSAVIFATQPWLLAPLAAYGWYSMKANLVQAQRTEELQRRELAMDSKWYNFLRTTMLVVRGMRDIFIIGKGNTLIQSMLRNTELRNEKYLKTTEQNTKQDTKANLFGELASTISWGVLVAKVYFFRSIGVGDFSFYYTSLERIRSSFAQIGENLGSLTESVRLLRARYELEEYAQKTTDTRKIVFLNHAEKISFKGVKFRYPGSDHTVVDIDDFEIPAASYVALVGHNGAGKSTLIKLILGIYMPTEGDIFIGPYNTKNYRILCPALFQDYETWKGILVRERLEVSAMNDSAMSAEEAVEHVGISSIIAKKRLGLDTRLDPTFKDGSDFSGGQHHILGFASVIGSGAHLLVTDEPCSDLDTDASDKVTHTLRSHNEATRVTSSHNFGFLRDVDLVIAVNDGKIVESGTHEELMNRTGGYYRVQFNKQANRFADKKSFPPNQYQFDGLTLSGGVPSGDMPQVDSGQTGPAWTHSSSDILIPTVSLNSLTLPSLNGTHHNFSAEFISDGVGAIPFLSVEDMIEMTSESNGKPPGKRKKDEKPEDDAVLNWVKRQPITQAE